jgi:hypothetical protein
MIFDQFKNTVRDRIKENMQVHLRGNDEEFDAAANAVMQELVSMGNTLQNMILSRDGTAPLTMNNESDREKLEKQLTLALQTNESWK